jgi:mevalonate kinase
MNLEKKYHAKLMLAGEYGVILGSEAITVPLEMFHARLARREEAAPDEEEKITASVNSIRDLITYILSLPRNSFHATPEPGKFDQLLKKGLYIASTIPGGYGIGSSGAVSALFYDQFFQGTGELDLKQKRKDLSTIESFFHGKSSGVDPMTCYTGTPLHFLPGGEIREVESNPLQPGQGYRFFLLDSGVLLSTGPLVRVFMEKMRDPLFSDVIRGDYFTLISKFIGAITGRSAADPALIFRAISDLQWNHFREMIPEQMEAPWIDGQVSNTYYLKLNGSGGGFVLGIAHQDSMEAVESMLEKYSIRWL